MKIKGGIMKKKENKTKNVSLKSKVKKQPLANIDIIKEKAYHIWLEKGCPENCDLENWCQAELELSIL